ncbi:hypothetical protein U1Q18_036994 [Sarracenia purpurea var. burkii]
MAVADDFSFSTTADISPCLIGSPPLWHRSTLSTVSLREEPQTEAPKRDFGFEDENGHFAAAKSINSRQRKSFSYIERGGGARATRDDGDEEEAEKMDVLWEDFNEEIWSTRRSGIEYSDTSPGRAGDFGCVGALKFSRTGGGGTVFSSKKRGVVVFMKVLKKVFLIQNSHPSLRRRTR